MCSGVVEHCYMKLTEDQITSFQKLYKEELGIEITRREALEKALSLLRFLELSTSRIDDEPLSP